MAEGPEEMDGVGDTYFGTLDLILVIITVSIAILLVRRFFFRKKEDKVPKLHIDPRALGKESGGASISSGSFLERMKARNKKVVVFYGSQTGTAEEFANRLAKDASRIGMPAITCDPEDVTDWEDLGRLGREVEGSMAIFCLATYGEGDPTDNTMEFHDWLKDSTDSLEGLKYTVFGLGNKTYEHYNEMGRIVDKKLEALGANRVYTKGEGDDDANIEEDFITWKENLWPAVIQFYGIDISQATQVGREYELTLHGPELATDRVFTGEPNKLGSYNHQKPPFNSKNPFMAKISTNRELHKSGDRSCMHIEIDISGSKMSYIAGDHVAILPQNDNQLVNKLGELLQADLDTVFSLTNVDDESSKPHPFPCPTTYRTALTHYVDITSRPRTHILMELIDYATDPNHRDFILKLTSPTNQGKREYSDWIVKDNRNIVAVLEDLPSFRPPIDHLLELLPRLQVRYYSISSSPKLHPSSVHITAVLVEYQTKTNRIARGVATSWLKQMIPKDGNYPQIPVYIRRSSLRLPYRPVNPVIMIGPGTGLAPFRGFIQDRAVDIRDKKKVGETVLFFGCRKRSEDYIYEDELTKYREDDVLSGLHIAFSRDQAEKVYVQHKMEENGEEIWQILENQGFFYVCGDARNMARDVQNTLLKIIKDKGMKTDTEATEYIKKLQKRGHYLQDVWS